VVLVPDRDRVRQELRERGIATNVPYIPPVHLQPVHKHLHLAPGSFPVSEHLAERLVGLPLYPGLTPEQADDVAAAVLDAVAAVAGRR
jgi:dTDP-4-amino-4,6-dideoxygalactose transaminase